MIHCDAEDRNKFNQTPPSHRNPRSESIKNIRLLLLREDAEDIDRHRYTSWFFAIIYQINRTSSRWYLWPYVLCELNRGRKFSFSFLIVSNFLFYPISWGNPHMLSVYRSADWGTPAFCKVSLTSLTCLIPTWTLLFRNVYKSNKKKTTLWNKKRPLLHMSLNISSIKFLRTFNSENLCMCDKAKMVICN